MGKSIKNAAATTIALLLLPLPGIISCSGKNEPQPEATVTPARCQPRIIRTLPHDENAFTQGLCYDRGTLYESDGIRGESDVRALDTNGTVILNRPLSALYFGEGCALFDGRLYQLTWEEQQCFVYSLPGLDCIDTLSYSGEGWGLTSNGYQLIMSNGSDTLYFRNGRFSLLGKIPVTCEGKPLGSLNELEYARGRVYANVWHSDWIFEIDPQRGIVERIINCSELVALEAPMDLNEKVLNGIAYNPETGLFYVTGKKWKNMFVVEIPAP